MSDEQQQPEVPNIAADAPPITDADVEAIFAGVDASLKTARSNLESFVEKAAGFDPHGIGFHLGGLLASLGAAPSIVVALGAVVDGVGQGLADALKERA